MLMPVDETREALGPIAHALSTRESRMVLDDIDRRAAQIVAKILASHGFAEIVPGCVPQWHLVLALPGKERLAADELRDRGFGVYLPEDDITEIKRGRMVTRWELLLPGYVLIFGWNIDSQLDRIRACDGVRDVLLRDGHAFIVPECMVDVVRESENKLRPIAFVTEGDSETRSKKSKNKRWRKSRNPDVPAEDDCTIIGVHAYSPIIEEARQAMLKDKADERVQAFNRALGL